MKLVAHWRLWWRRWSTWAAQFNAALVTTLIAKSGMLFGFVGFLPFVPGHLRGFAAGALAVLIFLFMAVVPVLIAHIRQDSLKEKADAVRK